MAGVTDGWVEIASRLDLNEAGEAMEDGTYAACLVKALARAILELKARVEELEDELSEAKEMLGGYLDGRQQGTGPTTPGTTPTDRMG